MIESLHNVLVVLVQHYQRKHKKFWGDYGHLGGPKIGIWMTQTFHFEVELGNREQWPAPSSSITAGILPGKACSSAIVYMWK